MTQLHQVHFDLTDLQLYEVGRKRKKAAVVGMTIEQIYDLEQQCNRIVTQHNQQLIDRARQNHNPNLKVVH